MDKQKAEADWNKFLSAPVFKHNLALCGLYLVSYELLRSSVIDQIRRFFEDANGATSPHYQHEVLDKDKSVFRASCQWLRSADVLDDQDLAAIDRIRAHRNAIAHEIQHFVSDTAYEVDTSLLARTRDLVAKIDRWWIRNVHMTIDPTCDGVDVDDRDLTSGTMVLLDLVTRLAMEEHGSKEA